MQVEIEHLDVASVVKISFLIYAVMGIVVGVVYVFLALALGGILGDDQVMGDGGVFRLAATGLGLLLVPVLALVYGLVGAIGGAILALVYNVLSKTIGGVKITLGSGVVGGARGGVEGQTEVRL